MENMNARITIRGRVQGVYFRATASDVATKAGVTGTVRNTPAGDVEIVAEGSKEAVDELIRWCRTGPDGAQVDSVEVNAGTYRGEFKSFKVIS
jgi:acylphosphatase